MSKTQNPLREVASSAKFNVSGGSSNLVANGVYSVEDIVKPLITYDPTVGDPRLYASDGHRRTRVTWRKVNSNGWISPKARSQDDTDTVVQVKFANPKKVNFVSFELLRVPQVWHVEYYDHNRKQMIKLTDSDGREVGGSLSGFKTNVVAPNQTRDEQKKWRKFSYNLPTIRTNLIELHLNREIEHVDESNFFGLPENTAYSLGVRNLRVKMKITNDEDVDDDIDDDGGTGPIGTIESPVIMRHTSIMAHDGEESTYWECAPQGAATSVVPFYLDLRQPDGTASIFDTLKMVPLWPGPSMSVYYSNDDTTLPWTLSPNRVDLETEGNASPGFVEDMGLLVDVADSAYTISNTYLRMDTSKSFVSGFRFTPTFTDSGNDRWLWNFESGASELGLKFDPTSSTDSTVTGQFKAMQDATVVLATFGDSFVLDKGVTYAVVVGYNVNDYDAAHPRGWYLSVSQAPGSSLTVTTQFVEGVAPTGFIPTVLRLGTNAAMLRPAMGYLSHIWFRLDWFTQRTADVFLLAHDTYISGEGDVAQRVNGYYNGIMAGRFTHSLKARVGPGAGFFRSKEWTPVPIDYTLSTNQYQLPVIEAKFLKLEFSNLIARTYITDLEGLPVTDFPTWVKDWYRSVSPQSVPYGQIDGGRNYYEGVTPLRTPGDYRQHPTTREILEGGGGGGLPPIIYRSDQSSADSVSNPEMFDRVGTYKELQFATTPFRFMQTGHHEYVTTYAPAERRAFFVGLKELQVFRSDLSVLMDVQEYAETYDDDQYINTNSGWINVGGSMQSEAVGDEIVSVEFASFSKFTTIQAAVLDSPWESPMSRDQIDLGSTTHLLDPTGVGFEASSTTLRTYVTGQYQGARGGNVIEIAPSGYLRIEYGTQTANYAEGLVVVGGSSGATGVIVIDDDGGAAGTLYLSGVTGTFEVGELLTDSATGSATIVSFGHAGEYGVKTDTGMFVGSTITGDNPRTSAVVRMQLPSTNNGTYELRLYADDGGRKLVASKPIRIPIKSWQEVELAYIANTGEGDWEVEVVQTNKAVSEPFVVDMLGIWQNPVKWEFSNDGGGTYQKALWTLNKPNGYIRFLAADANLIVRTTALKVGAVISGWTIVPWYIESPMVARAPIDLNPPWNASDSEILRDTSHKPMFRLWNHWFPQGYSVNLYGYY